MTIGGEVPTQAFAITHLLLRALSVMGARREGIDAQTRVVSVFRYRDGRQV
jgi:hypothetical protein